MNTEIKVDKQPSYVSTGRISDSKGKYVAGTQTVQQAVVFVTATNLYFDLINKYAND